MSDRGERCRACGKPTCAGEDFDGPCVDDSDLACALRQRDAARHEAELLRVVLSELASKAYSLFGAACREVEESEGRLR